MAGTVNLLDTDEVTLALIFRASGNVVNAPPGGSATSDNEAVATVSVSPDDSHIVVVSVGDGTANITYTNGSLTDSCVVIVAAPVVLPDSVEIDTANPVFAPKS